MSYEPMSPMSPMSTRRLTGRNANRYSVTALFSMAAEQDVEVEDDLAKGSSRPNIFFVFLRLTTAVSPETTSRPQVKDISTVEKELCVGTRCPIPGFSDCPADSKQNGLG